MTHFIKNGNMTRITDQASFDIRDHLPAGTYTVKQDPLSNEFYLENIDNFELPSKLYGDIEKTATRVYNTFRERPHGTGALLGGEKGSGKTLLTKVISERARINDSVPTLVINSPFLGEEFNQFIQHIDQPAIILFDEFEKVYDREQQNEILTLLDGVYPTKKLYLLTVNDEYGINKHMVNRPGRLYYRISYAGLEASFIREYAQDTLDNKDNVEAVVRLAEMYASFNFDMLKSIVEECNRYDEHPTDAVKVLNARPDGSEIQSYTVEVRHESGRFVEYDDDVWRGKPFLGMSFYLKVYKLGCGPKPGTPKQKRDPFANMFGDDNDLADEDYEYMEASFEPQDYRGQTADGKMVFSNSQGFTVALTKYVEQAANMYHYNSIEF